MSEEEKNITATEAQNFPMESEAILGPSKISTESYGHPRISSSLGESQRRLNSWLGLPRFFFLIAYLGLFLFIYLLVGLCDMLDLSSPDQGSNLCPLQWKKIVNHWATREVPGLPRS